MKLKKRAQGDVVDAGQASLLVLIIIGAILVYILFVPPDVREKLLGENVTEHEPNGQPVGKVLLDESPGRIDTFERTGFEHSLPSFHLYRTTSAEILESVPSVYAKNAVFDRRTANVTFSVDDVENTDNIILSFKAKRHTGILFIFLNGREIFSGEINQYNPAPIPLPEGLLRDTNNLQFRTSDPGWRIWLSHEYMLTDLRIIGDVTDVSRQEAKNVFYISETEYENIEKATFQFMPECQSSKVGNLEVSINYRTVFSGVPDCGMVNFFEFSPDILAPGSNRVIFKTTHGNYLIDRISVDTRLGDALERIYYFEISGDQYDLIMDGLYDATLQMEFVDEGGVKDGLLVINGRKSGFYTRKRTHTKVIDSYINEGNNAVKIVPSRALNIINLVISLK